MAHIGRLHNQGSSRYYIPALVCAVLLVLLMASCRAGLPPEELEDEPPSNKPEETAIGDLLETLDETLEKVQGRTEAFERPATLEERS